MSAYYVPPSPQPYARGRAYSLTQPSHFGYPSTPYSGYNTSLALPHTPLGVARSAPYYVTPTVRSRSHSRPRHSSHHRSQGHHHHGHRRRSHSVTASPRHHRSTGHHNSHRYQTGATSSYYPYHSPSLGTRILNFFGLGNNSRYVDTHGRSVDHRGRTKHKY